MTLGEFLFGLTTESEKVIIGVWKTEEEREWKLMGKPMSGKIGKGVTKAYRTRATLSRIDICALLTDRESHPFRGVLEIGVCVCCEFVQTQKVVEEKERKERMKESLPLYAPPPPPPHHHHHHPSSANLAPFLLLLFNLILSSLFLLPGQPFTFASSSFQSPPLTSFPPPPSPPRRPTFHFCFGFADLFFDIKERSKTCNNRIHFLFQ